MILTSTAKLDDDVICINAAFYVNAASEGVKMSIYFLEMQSKLNDETLSLHLTKKKYGESKPSKPCATFSGQ